MVRYRDRNRNILITLVLLLIAAPGWAAKGAPGVRQNEDRTIRHALDRIAFGPRPEDVERVRAMGLERYIDEQLHPERIPDPRVDEALNLLPTLRLSPEELTGGYRAMVQQAMQRSRARRATTSGEEPGKAERERREAQRKYRAFQVRVVGELQMAKTVRAVESERQLQEVMVDFWTNHLNIDVRKGPARALKTVDDREVIRPHALGRFRDLLGASAKSPAMLVYLDNVRSTAPMPARPSGRSARPSRGGLNENYARELMELHTLGVDGGYTQEDVIAVARCFTGWTINPRTGAFVFAPRRHDDGEKVVLGHKIPAGGGRRDGERVLDILAGHPSTSRHIARKLCQRFVADDPPASVVDRAAKTFRATDGDIRAVVRAILTSPEFLDPSVYRAKTKSPFEYAVSAVRALDGHVVLRRAPAPAVARRAGAGARLAEVQALAVGVDAAMRESGAEARGPAVALRNFGGRSLAGRIAAMGEPLFQEQAPTGYPEDSRMWVGAGALVARIRFADDLASGRVADVSFPPPSFGGAEDRSEALAPLMERIIGDGISEATRRAVEEAARGDETGPGRLTALLLGSPEFQRR